MTDTIESKLKLYEFTDMTNHDGTQVVRVSGRIADHPVQEEQKEWITFQFSIDVPTTQNGASLRANALNKAREILHGIALDFGTIGNRYF